MFYSKNHKLNEEQMQQRTIGIQILCVLLSLLLMYILLNPPRSKPVKTTENICTIFKQKPLWHKHTQDAYKKWGTPIALQMAIIYTESSFKANAFQKFKTKTILQNEVPIPWSRVSSASGYMQALDAAWQDYLESTDQFIADRYSFKSATDFIGWYTNAAHQRLGIDKTDSYNLYLAYHEGFTGYKQKRHLQKPWLLNVAKRLEKKTELFQKQLKQCRL